MDACADEDTEDEAFINNGCTNVSVEEGGTPTVGWSCTMVAMVGRAPTIGWVERTDEEGETMEEDGFGGAKCLYQGVIFNEIGGGGEDE
ncbi:hypothetical protein QJS10_CPA07g01400 [Acorus calamus]|uniref:Uncharacterized protein n=1 Tax=Acorus calamus TaxID=4465 RepID=A0AAV9EL14_ACOCL|nr:hypothetical protein QJS10_CPA07g01400 [Acorus calamus]